MIPEDAKKFVFSTGKNKNRVKMRKTHDYFVGVSFKLRHLISLKFNKQFYAV